MHAVEGAGEDEVVVGGEGGGAREAEGTGCWGWVLGGGGCEGVGSRGGESAVVDEGAGFGDYEEGENRHGGVEGVVQGNCGQGRYIVEMRAVAVVWRTP